MTSKGIIKLMLQLSKALSNIPVMSLRTGGRVATALKPIINPNNLKIEGWYCEDRFDKHTLILLSQDVRDIVPQGIAVNDYENLVESGELVRMRKILETNFELLGKAVYTDTNRRLGKVNDYALDAGNYFIHKFYVTQPVYRNLSGGQLSIDRSQIVEITNKRITVRDVDEKVGAPVTVTLGAQ